MTPLWIEEKRWHPRIVGQVSPPHLAASTSKCAWKQAIICWSICMLILMNYKSYSSKSNQPADGSVHLGCGQANLRYPIWVDVWLWLMSCIPLFMPYAKDKPIGLYLYVQSYHIHIICIYIIYICRDTHKEPRLITKTHRCIIFRCFHPPFPAAQVAQTVVVDANRGRGRRCSDNRWARARRLVLHRSHTTVIWLLICGGFLKWWIPKSPWLFQY